MSRGRGNKRGRGGRGGSGTRGRGGSRGRGNSGRFPNQNRGRYRGKTEINASNEFPELMDLDENGYTPSTRAPKARPGLGSGRRMFDEVKYTDAHSSETLRRPLRNNPIEFIKAKEVYDPSADLFSKLSGVGNSNVTVTRPRIERETPPQHDDPMEMEMEIPKELINNPEMTLTPKSPPLTVVEVPTSPSEHQNEQDSSDDDAANLDFFIDDVGDANVIGDRAKPLTSLLVQQHKAAVVVKSPTDSCVEFDPVLTIGKVSLQTRVIDDSVEAELMSVNALNKATRNIVREEKKATTRFQQNVVAEESEDEDKAAAYRDYIQQVMGNFLNNSSDEDEDEDEEEEFDYADVEAGGMTDNEESESEDSSDEEEIVVKKEKKPRVPDYGFLPEDFEFDVSTIHVDQIRQGISNQYHIKAYAMTGSYDEYVWIDEEQLLDYVTSNGVPEGRIDAFLKYIGQGLVEEDPDSQPDYSDIYISETSEEEGDGDDDVDDGLDYAGFVNATKNHQNFLDNEIPTETLRTKGRGKKKRLDIDHIDDIALRESLQEQYLIQKESRKDRKKKRAEMIASTGANNHNLLLKYLTGMHIREIRDEFESLLHDTRRDSTAFPPMDPHGLKTVKQLAEAYNMKSRKLGSGLSVHIAVVKTKRTFHSFPNYDVVTRLLRQRPIFNRIDVKRTQQDQAATGDAAKVRRGKPIQAGVREGQIVGESAPELAHDNIGRKMLERLGWVKGSGLGASGNEGISEPVVAKVKMNKVGLK